MEHLKPEALARLVDEIATDAEREHLQACAACREEIGALREQTAALSSLPDLRPPTGDWEVLQARLVSEGLMDGGGRLRALGLANTPRWMKGAAAVLLFVTGMGFGAGVAPRLTGDATVAGFFTSPLRAVSGEPASLEDAAQQLRLAERRYMDAVVQYRQMADVEGEALPSPENRVAALEYLARHAQVALREAPADPYVNGFVASLMAEREAALRQISGPEGSDWF